VFGGDIRYMRHGVLRYDIVGEISVHVRIDILTIDV
jgi:hypothetical protein